MKSYIRVLICEYCGVNIGHIEIEDIEEPSIIDVQCIKCEVNEE